MSWAKNVGPARGKPVGPKTGAWWRGMSFSNLTVPWAKRLILKEAASDVRISFLISQENAESISWVGLSAELSV